jgi:hypothetical protein
VKPWQGASEIAEDTGPVGPVALLAFLLLIGVSPLMRGGNRHVALTVLEGVALAFLVALAARAGSMSGRLSIRTALLVLLVSSPAWLAVVYLVPIPAATWVTLPLRRDYTDALTAAGIAMPDWLPISMVPDATATSLFAGIPLVAAFLAGFWMRLPQLNGILKVFVAIAFFEVLVGLLQAAGGTGSSLYFGGIGGRPFGTFANPNHFANYLAMALAAYVWLGWSRLGSRHYTPAPTSFLRTPESAVWAAGGVLLVIGVLMSRSRGAMVAGLPAALCALVIAVKTSSRNARNMRARRRTLAIAIVGVIATLSIVGLDGAISRFTTRSFTSDLAIRADLAMSTLQGAMQLWPVGSGWGTFSWVYPRFQPPGIVGFANQAHHDYAQLLFEGGVFALVLMLAFAWLAVTRAALLVRAALRRKRLHREEMACVLCGLGLLGFLVHSLLDFNMHIPANAIMAALLAGVYLRPLEGGESAVD